MVPCPWHEDRTPSMAVYRKQGRAWCFSCSKGGDVLDVTTIMLNTDVRGAVRYRSHRLNLSPSRPSAEEMARIHRERERRRIREVCRRLSYAVERGMPRPHDPDLIELWDYAFTAKESIDEQWWKDDGPSTKEEVKEYVSELQAWRKRWEDLLRGANGEGWDISADV